MKIMKYKNYLGSMEIGEEDGCLFGKLLHINDLIMYQGQTVPELREAFERAVDDYLVTCKELGWEPKKPCSGTFNVRIGAEMHLAASEAATLAGVNLNEYVKQAIQEKLERADRTEIHVHHNTNVYTGRFTTTLSDEGHGVSIDESRFIVKSSKTSQEAASRH